MCAWIPRPGKTIFIPSGPDGEHLFVIIIGPKTLSAYGTDEQFIAVPICSAIPRMQHECPLDAGSHPFVRHASYADFYHARLLNNTELTTHIASGQWHTGEDVGADILHRITQSILTSRRVPRYLKRDFLGD